MTPSPAPISAAILAFPETTASVTYGMYDLFMAAGRDWGFVVDGQPGPCAGASTHRLRAGTVFTAANDVQIAPQGTLDECADVDIVCVPELAVPPGEPLTGRFTDEIGWLKRCYARGATLATACSGAVLLAEAGLLDGQEATTHWAYCDILRSRYPAVKVRTERALVVSGDGQRLVMAGGGTSWLDLALYLIARFVGVDAAMQVARINLIDWHSVGQQPFARLARSRQVDDAVIARCQTWIAEHYHEPSPGDRDGAAERVGRALVQAPVSAGDRNVAAGVCAYAAPRRGEADARGERAADRGHRQRSRLRGRRLLQPSVPAPGQPHAGAVP